MREDLVLITLNPGKGVLQGSAVLPYGLNAAGLADLVVLGHVALTRPDGSLGITPPRDGTSSVGEPLLDRLLTAIRAASPADLHPQCYIRERDSPARARRRRAISEGHGIVARARLVPTGVLKCQLRCSATPNPEQFLAAHPNT